MYKTSIVIIIILNFILLYFQMALWKLFFIATAGFLFLQIVVGVDKNNFKTCEQSSFCRRLRQLTPESTLYELLLNTIVLDKHSLSADIRNNNNNVINLLALIIIELFQIITLFQHILGFIHVKINRFS